MFTNTTLGFRQIVTNDKKQVSWIWEEINLSCTKYVKVKSKISRKLGQNTHEVLNDDTEVREDISAGQLYRNDSPTSQTQYVTP